MKFKVGSFSQYQRGCLLLIALIIFSLPTEGQILKSILYDFDGQDIGQTDLPDGDYKANDLSYHVAANPLGANDMLGDRVLKLDLNWSASNGTFGKGTSRFIEFDATHDVFNFYFYNPPSNGTAASIEIAIGDDDNGDNVYSINNDDLWVKDLTLSTDPGWQLIAIPLQDFTDSNSGGNGIFDIGFGNKGMMLMVEFRFNQGTSTNATYYLDMICFTDGALPHGPSIFDLPAPIMPGKCPLGAFEQKPRGDEYLIPGEIESFFPPVPVKKIKYVNWFLDFAMDGTTLASAVPGNEVTTLLTNGYRPIITWEPLFNGYSRLDPVQPRLNNIINGDYDTYINSFADQIKSYNDTIIIRFMHEFEGDWYPWSITYNGHNPTDYITAFRKVVDMFRARGASKVKWMWCLNSDYAPYENYNWDVLAYPGDSYVDIVATDIYNNHFPVNSPWWVSFRYRTAESYYYLTKYFPQKPLMICELGCRERVSTEDLSSQTKGEWIAVMDKELQSNFSKVKGVVFFSGLQNNDWRINSSTEALDSIQNNIWDDDYYFDDNTTTTIDKISKEDSLDIFPNPSSGKLKILFGDVEYTKDCYLEIYNMLGKKISQQQNLNEIDLSHFQNGVYYIKIYYQDKKYTKKIVVLTNL